MSVLPAEDTCVLLIPRSSYGFEFSINENGHCKNSIRIARVRKLGTAEKVGLVSGSQIIAVNGQALEGLSFLQISNLIRRSSGLSIELTVIKSTLANAGESNGSANILEPQLLPCRPLPRKSSIFREKHREKVEDSSSPLYQPSFDPDDFECGESLNDKTLSDTQATASTKQQPMENNDPLSYEENQSQFSIETPSRQPSILSLDLNYPISMSLDSLSLDSDIKPMKDTIIAASSPLSESNFLQQNDPVESCYRMREETSSLAAPLRSLRRQAVMFTKSGLLPSFSVDQQSPIVALQSDEGPLDNSPVVIPVQNKTPDECVDSVKAVESVSESLAKKQHEPAPIRKQAYSFSNPSTASPQPRFLPAHSHTFSSIMGNGGPKTPPLTFLPGRSSLDNNNGADKKWAALSPRFAGEEELCCPVDDDVDGPVANQNQPVDGSIKKKSITEAPPFTNLATYLQQFVVEENCQFPPTSRQQRAPPPTNLYFSGDVRTHRRLSEHDQPTSYGDTMIDDDRSLQYLHQEKNLPACSLAHSKTAYDRIGSIESHQKIEPNVADWRGSCFPSVDSQPTSSNSKKGFKGWLKSFKSDDVFQFPGRLICRAFSIEDRRFKVSLPLPQRSYSCNLPGHLSTLPNSYVSRECLCRIVRLDDKPAKLYPWKRYFMCIGDGAVRFVKGSTAQNSSRSSKPIRCASEEVTTAPSTSATPSLVDNPSANLPLWNQSSTRCVIIPLTGLVWRREDSFPADLPAWNPFPVRPKWATAGGSSGDEEKTSTAAPWSAGQLSTLPCYRFEHPDRGTELLLVFPDENAASVSLTLCQKYGAGEHKENSNPAARPTHPVDTTSTTTPGLLSYSQSMHCVPGSSLQRGAETTDDRSRPKSSLRRTRKSLPDAATRRKVQANVVAGVKRLRDKSKDRRLPRDVLEPGHDPIELRGDASTEASMSSIATDGPSKYRFGFLRSIANLINRSNTPSGVIENQSSQDSSENLAVRIAAVLAEPPDLTDVNEPGQVFGATLESQIQSPDIPGVPLMLHALIRALEVHGLHHVGLYRAPGRQKEINRFVCLANMSGLDPEIMLCCDAWKDIRALTGLVKLFLRRLPTLLFDMEAWTPLTILLPENQTDMDISAFAFALLAIREQLEKTFRQPGSSSSTSLSSSVSLAKISRWRLATLDFLFTHLRRLVQLQAANQISYECISICFGPVLFGTGSSEHMTKINKVVEIMLQHWPWLVASLPSPREPNAFPETAISRPDLSMAKLYVTEFLEHGGSEISESSLSMTTAASILQGEQETTTNKNPLDDVFNEIQSIFARAGLIWKSPVFTNYQDSSPSLLESVLNSLPDTAKPTFDSNHQKPAENKTDF